MNSDARQEIASVDIVEKLIINTHFLKMIKAL